MALYVDPTDTGTTDIPREEFNWTLRGRIHVVDQGATLVGLDKFLAYMAKNAFTVIEFDPTSRLQDQTHLQDIDNLQIVPHALMGDGQMATLYACLDPEMSGTLEPLAADGSSKATLDSARVLTRMPISTLSLDKLDDVTSVDWLLLDAVNDNIAALDSSIATLHEALLIHVCVPVTPTHRNQAGLEDIRQWMRKHEFECRQLNSSAQSTSGIEAIFTPSPDRLARYDAERLSKLAFILDTVYSIYDYSYTLLNRVDPEGAKRYQVSRGYISSYDAEPDMFTLTAQYSPLPSSMADLAVEQHSDISRTVEPDGKKGDELFASGVAAQAAGQLPAAVAHYRAALDACLYTDLPTSGFVPSEASDNKYATKAVQLLMWDALSRLARSGVHAFPMGDTLLGLSRDGDLPLDKSLCFGVPFCEHESATQCLEDNGWTAEASGHIANPVIYFHPEQEVSLELVGFVVDADNGKTYSGMWMDNIPWAWANNKQWPTLTLEKDITPSGEPIWTLEEPAEYLEAGFGDWRTPDPHFDSVVADKNLCGFSLLTQCHAFARLYESLTNGQLNQARAYLDYMAGYLTDDILLQRIQSRLQALSEPEDADCQANARMPSSTDY